MAPRIFVVAGEVSGDHEAAGLIARLRRLRPEVEIRGAGGGRMAAAGADVVIDSTRWGVIGYAEAYARLPLFALRYGALVRAVERCRPDLLLLVDFPGMNRELVRRFSGRLPLVYFVPPQTYGRRSRSAARLARAAVRLLAVLPFEADAYRRAGADVTYVGHPAVDAADAAPAPPSRPGGGGPLVALLPGSRTQEVRALLGPMLDAARALDEAHHARFVLPLAAPHLHQDVERAIARTPIPVRVAEGGAREALRAADAAVLASGTAAVEAACTGTPMVVVYRVSALTEWIARRFVVTSELDAGFSIPNLVLGRRAVPDLVQREVTGPRIAAELERLLTDPEARRRMSADLAEVRRRLGPPGALDRAAAEVIRALDSRPGTTLP